MLRAVSLLFCLATANFALAENTEVTKVSEALGHMIGRQLENFGLDLDMEALVKGLKEESEGNHSSLNDDECMSAIHALQEEKIHHITQKTLDRIDAISNGDLLYENHSFPTTNSTKHWEYRPHLQRNGR